MLPMLYGKMENAGKWVKIKSGVLSVPLFSNAGVKEIPSGRYICPCAKKHKVLLFFCNF